jgi:hypothetical protein
MGNTRNVAATCEIKTIDISNVFPPCVYGTTQVSNNVAVQTTMLIQYHFFSESEMSTIGPQTNLHRLADIPIATMPAASATEKPALVSKKGNVTVTKPWQMPAGKMIKNI